MTAQPGENLTLTQREDLPENQRLVTWETSFQNIPHVTSQVSDDEGSLTLDLEVIHDDSDDDVPALEDSQSDGIIVYSRQEHQTTGPRQQHIPGTPAYWWALSNEHVIANAVHLDEEDTAGNDDCGPAPA